MTLLLDPDMDLSNSTFQFEEFELRVIMGTLAVGLNSLSDWSSLPTQPRCGSGQVN